MTAHRHGPRRAALSAEVRVVCDGCGDPWPPATLVLYRRYAICVECIAFVRASDDLNAARSPYDVAWAASGRQAMRDAAAVEGAYTKSAATVRRYFGLDGIPEGS